MKKIIAFTGSNHSHSIHQQLLNIAVGKVMQNEVTMLDLSDYPLPIYSVDIEVNGIPEEVYQLKKELVKHDAIIIAAPEHNGSMPAYLKNVIDWLSRLVPPKTPFFGDEAKPVLLMSTSPGVTGGATNIKSMAALMPWWGGDVKATYSLGSYFEKMIDGKLTATADQELTDIIKLFETQL
ncbi:NAD(P)H-dependent oxidoreductase [Shewanella gelidimarina]|uniref:NADPH-dependent FMN reductase n=1 Tax=Shewanella gelidimarina TaxID=56813 RepID=UPI00200FB3F2|nr:NAD(P)H-dependent oxidoreductase [Shewanella gelidimarina]MCL1057505.1 NAD(P)H-dependent oxidoreductase [Shewanella gelidimarina]